MDRQQPARGGETLPADHTEHPSETREKRDSSSARTSFVATEGTESLREWPLLQILLFGIDGYHDRNRVAVARSSLCNFDHPEWSLCPAVVKADVSVMNRPRM